MFVILGFRSVHDVGSQVICSLGVSIGAFDLARSQSAREKCHTLAEIVCHAFVSSLRGGEPLKCRNPLNDLYASRFLEGSVSKPSQSIEKSCSGLVPIS